MNGDNQPVNMGSDNRQGADVTSSTNTKARSKLLIVSSVLAVLFFISTSVFVALFTYTHILNAEQDPTTEKMCSPTNCVTQEPSADEVCNTPECVRIAGRMINKMNVSADPCVDFDEFACGRFKLETLIPDGLTSAGFLDTLEDISLLVLKGILTEEIRKGETLNVANMKRAYMSCMAVDEGTEDELYSRVIKAVAVDWPTINLNWTSSSFNLSSIISRNLKIKVSPFFSFYDDLDYKDARKKSLYMDLPTLGLYTEYFIRPRNNTVLKAYQKYLTDIAIEVGAPKEVAEQDAKDVVDLQVALSLIFPTKEEARDVNKIYNPMDLRTLSTLYPDLFIPQVLRMAVSVPDSDIVINKFPTYLGNLSRVIKQFSNRTLTNLFGVLKVYPISQLSSRLKAIGLSFYKVFAGQTGSRPQWQMCTTKVAKKYIIEIQQEYMARSFSDGIKSDIVDMFANIRTAFKQMVEENTWMHQATKQEVYKKLSALNLSIFDPFEKKQENVEAMIQQFALFDENDYTNQTQEDTRDVNGYIAHALRRQASRQESMSTVYEGSAEYSTLENAISVSPSILQQPFYSKSFPDYIKYGAIGTILAHELTHGFDDGGVDFDETGSMRNWMQVTDARTFRDRVQCIIDQTSGFYVEEIKMNLDGVYTQSESIADTSGLKESFRAYTKHVLMKGEDPRLPVMNLTPDQLFFLSFSQMWCEKRTKENTDALVSTDMHLPGRYRTIGALQNTEDFAKAFNCPRGSYMNPEKKCDVW